MGVSVKSYILLIVLVLASTAMHGQRKVKKIACQYYEAGLFQKAYEKYGSYNKLEKDATASLNRGISAYELGLIDDAEKWLENAYAKDKTLTDALFHLGKCQLDRGKYLEASQYYKSYLNFDKDITSHQLRLTKDLLKQCEYGTRISHGQEYAYIENMGKAVNTSYNELSPVQSPTSPFKYYFSSDRDISKGGKRNRKGLADELLGKYYYDMYAVELVNGNWTAVYPFNSLQNTSKHEIIQDFSKEGEAMIYMKGASDSEGIFLVDSFDMTVEKRAFPSRLNVPVFAEIEDRDLYFFNNHTLIFSSKREGGFGGYDLYITFLTEGRWSQPLNLGPSINSPYDDVSPFLTKGAKALYFSSNRPQSLGGYDIFVSKEGPEGWQEAINIGAPINSTRDDKDLILSSDGTQAVFASNRIGTLGGYDLYLAYWKEQILDQLMYAEFPTFLPTVLEEGVSNIETPIENKKDINIAPLYYKDDNGILAPSNLVVLNTIADLHKVYPNNIYTIATHSGSQNLRDFNLYFGIKRGEKVRDYLIAKGINADQLKVLSYGDSYPLGNDTNLAGQKNNSRIDIHVNNAYENILNVIYLRPIVPENEQVYYRDITYTDRNQLYYAIHIAETSQMLQGRALEADAPYMVIKDEDKLHYYLGRFETYDEARAYKTNRLDKDVFAQLEIVPFIEENAISIEAATSLSSTYPDLLNYLKMGK